MVFRLLALMLLLVAACTPQAPEALPTLAPLPTAANTDTPAPTQTPLIRATLPPTWTPEVQASPENDAAQAEATATTISAPAQPLAVFSPTALAVCAGFGEDLQRNTRTFPIGAAPTVYWTPVEGAVQYYVALVDENGEIVQVNYTAETGFRFDESLFEAGRLYGWEAYPIDALGQQMCLSRGAELIPEGFPSSDQSG